MVEVVGMVEIDSRHAIRFVSMGRESLFLGAEVNETWLLGGW